MSKLVVLVFTIQVGLVLIGCSEEDALDATENKYLEIWREVVIESGNMTEEYFDEHVIPGEISTLSWRHGESIRIDFIYNLGWVEVESSNSFIIYITDQELYKSYPIPREQYLEKKDIVLLVSNSFYSSDISMITPSEEIAFLNATGAISFLNTQSQSCHFEDFYLDIDSRVTGYPVLKSICEENTDLNNCQNGTLNLVTKDYQILKTACNR